MKEMPSHMHTCMKCMETRECPAPDMCLISGLVVCSPCVDLEARREEE